MTGNALLQVLRDVVTTARRRRIKIAIMGGIATSVYSPPRATFDIDGIADIERKKIESFLGELKEKGFSYDEKRPFKIIEGLPLVTLYFPRHKVYFDLFLAESEFQKLILARARTVRVDDLRLNIISPEDLILVKLISGRPRDTEDVRQILIENSEKLDFSYLRQWAKKLGVVVFLKDEMKSLGFEPARSKR